MKTSLLTLLCAAALCAQDLSGLPLLKHYRAERISSFDRAGGNGDGNQKNPIQAGETRTIGEVAGPGVITHIWIAFPSAELYHLKKYVLRMYWDGDPLPAVESPLGDFFGLGLGEYFVYESGPLSIGSQKALNCFFPMPFRKSARITLTNEGEQPLRAFYLQHRLGEARQASGGHGVLLRRVPAGRSQRRLDLGLEAQQRSESERRT